MYAVHQHRALRSGAIHWGKVGRVVFALSEASLYAMIGSHAENEPLRLSCRELFVRSGRPIEVAGPLIEEEARLVHEGFCS